MRRLRVSFAAGEFFFGGVAADQNGFHADEMRIHGGAGGLRVLRRDRAIDRLVFRNGGVALLRAEQRVTISPVTAPMRSNIGEYISAQHSSTIVGQHAVVARKPDAHVKQMIGGAMRRRIVARLLIIAHRLGDRRGFVAGSPPARRARRPAARSGAAPRSARAARSRPPRTAVAFVSPLPSAFSVTNVPAPTRTSIRPGDFERDHRLSHRRTADAEHLGEVAFRRQPVPRLEFAARHQVGDLSGDLLVQALCRDCPEWHARIPPDLGMFEPLSSTVPIAARFLHVQVIRWPDQSKCHKTYASVRCTGIHKRPQAGDAMRQAWRWYGPDDPVTLDHVRQAGATEIVTALHQYAPGEVWPQKAVAERKALIENRTTGPRAAQVDRSSKASRFRTTSSAAATVPPSGPRSGSRACAAVAAEGIRIDLLQRHAGGGLDPHRSRFPDADRRDGAALRLRPLRGVRSACAQAQGRGGRLRRGRCAPVQRRSPTRCRRATSELLTKNISAGLPGATTFSQNLDAFRERIASYGAITPDEDAGERRDIPRRR